MGSLRRAGYISSFEETASFSSRGEEKLTMPVLEAENKITPKSILRHRPIDPGKRSILPPSTTPIVPRASRHRPVDTGEDVAEWQRGDEQREHQARERHWRTKTARQSFAHSLWPWVGTGLTKKQHLYRAHPLFYLGVGVLAALILWTLLSAVLGWFTTAIDDIRYGRPRTFQTDAWVGHNEQTGIPSHFIALNLHRHIEIIEIPGGDASRARIHVGPQLFGANDDLVPVTLQFLDINGDHRPDMIVTFQVSRVVFINDQGGFRSPLPSERRQVEQFLQQFGQ
jgi:hypothetical protein